MITIHDKFLIRDFLGDCERRNVPTFDCQRQQEKSQVRRSDGRSSRAGVATQGSQQSFVISLCCDEINYALRVCLVIPYQSIDARLTSCISSFFSQLSKVSVESTLASTATTLISDNAMDYHEKQALLRCQKRIARDLEVKYIAHQLIKLQVINSRDKDEIFSRVRICLFNLMLNSTVLTLIHRIQMKIKSKSWSKSCRDNRETLEISFESWNKTTIGWLRILKMKWMGRKPMAKFRSVVKPISTTPNVWKCCCNKEECPQDPVIT